MSGTMPGVVSIALLVGLAGRAEIGAQETMVFGNPEEMEFEWHMRQVLRSQCGFKVGNGRKGMNNFVSRPA